MSYKYFERWEEIFFNGTDSNNLKWLTKKQIKQVNSILLTADEIIFNIKEIIRKITKKSEEDENKKLYFLKLGISLILMRSTLWLNKNTNNIEEILENAWNFKKNIEIFSQEELDEIWLNEKILREIKKSILKVQIVHSLWKDSYQTISNLYNRLLELI